MKNNHFIILYVYNNINVKLRMNIMLKQNIHLGSYLFHVIIVLRVQQNACSSNIELINFGSKLHLEQEHTYIQNILTSLNGNFILTSNEPNYLKCIVEPNQEINLKHNYLSSSIENYTDNMTTNLSSNIDFSNSVNKDNVHLVSNCSTINDTVNDLYNSIININNINLYSISKITNNIVFFLNAHNNDKSYFEALNKMLSKSVSINIHVIRNEGDFHINGIKIECDCNSCLVNSILKLFNFFNLDSLFDSLKFANMSSLDYKDGHQYSKLTYTTNLTFHENHIHNKQICKKTCSSINITDLNKHNATNNVRDMTGNITETILNTVNDPYAQYIKINSPKYILAPMINQTELAFRMFARQHGAQLCYTPMINAELFINNIEYQKELFNTITEDRPLIVQFAVNDPNVLLSAAKMVIDKCDYIDLNLGCPQPIARRHYYGAWLMEDYKTIRELIKALIELNVHVSCKIRICETIEDTIKYAKMLEQAGCSLLTIHGRERKSNMNLEPANWAYIKEVKKHLKIPVIANGSINDLDTAKQCLAFTECDGVMAASHVLENPYLFSGQIANIKAIALEYLSFAQKYNALLRYAKAHILQIFSKKVNQNILDQIKAINNIETLIAYIVNLPDNLPNNLTVNLLLDNDNHKKKNFILNVFDLVSDAATNQNISYDNNENNSHTKPIDPSSLVDKTKYRLNV